MICITGACPNLAWRAVTSEQLRLQHCYLPLPPPELLNFAPDQPQTWRMLRQECQLWSRLHNGVLTSRNMPDFLGLHEPKAGAFLDLPKSTISHTGMLQAIRELRAARLWWQEQSKVPGAPVLSPAHGMASVREDAMHTAIVFLTTCLQPVSLACVRSMPAAIIFNRDASAMLLQAAFCELGIEHPSSPPPIGPGLDERAVAAANRSEWLRYVRERAVDGSGTTHTTAAMAMPPWPEAKSASLQQLRMEWGNAHETTALAAFIAHTNSMAESAKRGGSISVLAETGLWMVDVPSLPPQILSKCPDVAAADPGQIPPIGASPDAMLARLSTSSAVNPIGVLLEDDTVWEPVEVKCICPFWEQRGGQGGRKRIGFLLNQTPPHGPAAGIAIHAAVQLQLQMMACGTDTAV